MNVGDDLGTTVGLGGEASVAATAAELVGVESGGLV